MANKQIAQAGLTTVQPRDATAFDVSQLRPGDPESFYFLLAYVMDLHRQLLHLHKAAVELPLQSRLLAGYSAPVAKEMWEEIEAISGAGRNWKERALVLEGIVKKVNADIGDAPREVLERLMTKKPAAAAKPE